MKDIYYSKGLDDEKLIFSKPSSVNPKGVKNDAKLFFKKNYMRLQWHIPLWSHHC